MSRWVYVAPVLLFVPAFAAMFLGGWLAWALPLFVFGVLPILDQTSRGTTFNHDATGERARLSDRTFDGLLYVTVPLQFGLLAAYLWRLSTGGFAAWETAGIVATMAIACGAYGINVAHELGHRREAHEQNLSKLLLLTSLYQHFFVEHNRGHHRHVATPDDPASAQRGQSVYAFWIRSVTGSYRHAWTLENERLRRAGEPVLSWGNAMVRYTVYQAAFTLGVGALFGPVALAGFVVAATGGFLLLETVNYVEHYGLSRNTTDHGGFERVRPHHSWNSNRPFGRVFLFDLTRHSDHHAHATRPYQVLRHFDEAPELPSGYTGMILLALVPPLFDRVMDRELARWEQRFGGLAEAA